MSERKVAIWRRRVIGREKPSPVAVPYRGLDDGGGAMRLFWTPRRIRNRRALRLAAVKRWQAEERDAARKRLIDLAANTPDPVRWRR